MLKLIGVVLIWVVLLVSEHSQSGHFKANAITEIASIGDPKAKQEPANAEEKENYWSKSLKPDILPVWIGGLAAIFAGSAGLCALYFIRKQTNLGLVAAQAAKDAAVAAREGVEIAAAAQRAWLLITGDPNEGFDSWLFSFKVTNYGVSPAEILWTQLCFKTLSPIVDLPNLPTYTSNEGNVFVNRRWLAPRESLTIDEFHSYGVFQDDPNLFEDLRSGRKRLWLYGIVRYRDTISKDVHETRFCYWRSVQPKVNLVMAGPPGYNDCT